jgi:hypothetical protein
MTTSTITAGDAANGLVVSGAIGNDGGLIFQTGPAGAKVNALTIDTLGNVKSLASAAPAFSAYQSVAQSLAATYSKIQLQTKEFDTATAFDAVTNYRFNPQVAGYYQVTAVAGTVTSNFGLFPAIYKNGTAFKGGVNTAGAAASGVTVTALVYLNGSTDYLEFFLYSTGVQNTAVGQLQTYFQAFLARSA